MVGVNGREGAEKQVGNVSKDGGAARGDAVFRQKAVKAAKGMVDALGGLKALSILGEEAGVVRGLLFILHGAMARAKSSARVQDAEAALAASGIAMDAADGNGVRKRSLEFHFVPRLGMEWGYPSRVFFGKSLEKAEKKGLAIFGSAKEFGI